MYLQWSLVPFSSFFSRDAFCELISNSDQKIKRIPKYRDVNFERIKRIKDPYLDYNELLCEWVSNKSWVYKTTLPNIVDYDGEEEENANKTISLVFQGLDTFARVKLNGIVIHESNNMFIPCRIDVTERYRRGRDERNILEIAFDSATRRAREIKDAHPEHRWVGYNGDMARLAVRKAQYHW